MVELKAHAKEAAVHMQTAAPSQPKTSLLEEEGHRTKKRKSCIIDKYDSTASEEKIPRKLLGQSKRRREYDRDRAAKIFMDEGGNQHGARKIIDLKELTTEEPFKMGHVYPAQLEHANIMKVIRMTMKPKNSTIEYDRAGRFIKGQETSYWATGVTGIEAAKEIMRYSTTRRDLLRSSLVKEITGGKPPAPAVEEDKKLATTTCGTDVAADDMVVEPERLTEEPLAPAVEEDKKLATTTCGTDVAADDMVVEPERLTEEPPAPAVEEDKKLATTTCGTDVAADDMVLEPERLTEEAALKKEEEED